MTDHDGVLDGTIVPAPFDGEGEWLPPVEACARLGISERTLWRRVDAGRFEKRVIRGRAEIWVPVAGTPSVSQAVAGMAGGVAAPPVPLEIVAEGLHRAVEPLLAAWSQELAQRRSEDRERAVRAEARVLELERENARLSATLVERCLPWPARLRRWFSAR